MVSYPLIQLTDSMAGTTQVLPAEGRLVTLSEVEQERTGRVSSGLLVSDVLYTKRKFSIAYSYLEADITANLITMRQSNNDLEMKFQELYSSTVETLTVRIIAPITRTRFIAFGVGAYTDVTIEIEEV